jgi:hypothetical protein
MRRKMTNRREIVRDIDLPFMRKIIHRGERSGDLVIGSSGDRKR